MPGCGLGESLDRQLLAPEPERPSLEKSWGLECYFVEYETDHVDGQADGQRNHRRKVGGIEHLLAAMLPRNAEVNELVFEEQARLLLDSGLTWNKLLLHPPVLGANVTMLSSWVLGLHGCSKSCSKGHEEGLVLNSRGRS